MRITGCTILASNPNLLWLPSLARRANKSRRANKRLNNFILLRHWKLIE